VTDLPVTEVSGLSVTEVPGAPELSYTHGTSTTPLLGDTIGANLDRAIAAHPDRDALVDVPSGRRWTYAEFGTAVDEVRATGGGARSPLWLQLQADVYGCPIRRTGVDEGPAYGAALLAGVASGVFTDLEAATSSVRLRESITEPDPKRARRYDELYAIFASLYPALRDAMHALGRR